MADEDPVDLELMLNRFKRLFGELMGRATTRQTFFPWEVDLMVDFQACRLPPKRRKEILHQWNRAVSRQLQTGPGPPLKLSVFLAIREQRRERLRSARRADPQFGTCRPQLSG